MKEIKVGEVKFSEKHLGVIAGPCVIENRDHSLKMASDIKIISESDSRNMRPDYYLVLAWHFKKEILKREKIARKQGVKFIFPLPNIEII